MGQVAREIGVTTVYYSQVENGKMPPFPAGKVSHMRLAEALSIDPARVNELATELQILAADTRGRLEFNVEKAKPNAKHMLVTLGRMVDENTLTDEVIARIQKELEGK
jgi:transcriptional regulator with XRE-family HTH domain